MTRGALLKANKMFKNAFFFIVLPLPHVANKFSSPFMDSLIIMMKYIFRIVFACYVEYRTDM